MPDKRSPNLGAEIRSQKRARNFPIAQEGLNQTVSPTDGTEYNLRPHRRSTIPSAPADSEDGSEKQESGAEEPAASLVEDSVHVEASEQPAQCGQNNEEDTHNDEHSPSSLPKKEEGKSDFSSPAERNLEGDTGPHDDLESNSSSSANLKTSSSPTNKLGHFEVEGSETASNVSDSNTRVHREQPGPWSPPPEPFRPENPYKKRLGLTIYRHEACPPFGQDYETYTDLRDRVLEKDLRHKTLVDLCIENPPMEGQTGYEDGRSLQVVEELRVKSDGGAQLVICRLDDDDQDYVAKIYDPLYYGFSDTMWPDLPRDVTFESDMDYCREVAAYEEMDEWVGGTDVPKFHGSWTFQTALILSTGRKMTRDVRMILIERVPGKSMLEFDQNTIPEAERLETLARMSELISRISFIGVHHHDISQRNIMICDGEKSGKVGRVALIDFNMSTVERLDNFEEQYGPRELGPDKPPNPLDRWWGGGWYGGFFEWLPERWERRLRPLQEWMYERWGKSDDFAPPVRDLVWDEENQPRSWIAW